MGSVLPQSDPAPRRLALYARLARLDRPIGILLLLWPTLDALWLAAAGFPGWRLLAVFVAGTALTRSAGCVVNDLADRRFDGHVERTAQRVLASGAVSVREAAWVALVLGAASAALLPLLDRVASGYCVVGAAVAVTYPFFKRFFALPQAWLGIAFSFGIPIAFAAVLGTVPPRGWYLFGANLFWVVAYDTEYAMVDRDDDLRLGLHSSAILFGGADVVAVMACYAAYFAILAALGAGAGFDTQQLVAYGAGLVAAIGCALYHFRLIRTRTRAGCLQAFRHNNWLGLCVFAGIAAAYLT
jgi:4-hydroxybenzoate polyprenyltransferase